MLTDIFTRRYEQRPLFDTVGPRELALFVQAYRMLNEQIFPYYGRDKKVSENAKAVWTSLHDRISMELGCKELSPRYFSYQTEWMGKPHTNSGWHEMNHVCEVWLTKPFAKNLDSDEFVKQRLSFVELAFRERENYLRLCNLQLDLDVRKVAQDDLARQVRLRLLGKTVSQSGMSSADRIKQSNVLMNEEFAGHQRELNVRLNQAGMPLHYHNGFIQVSTDSLTQGQIEHPFWDIVKDAKWGNVSTDMAEAIDLRDTGGRDPAFYAGKALESTLKIICSDKGWITGLEKGAADYLNHLESKSNGAFIDPWERKIMGAFFSGVRNGLGHGPGSSPMPSMSGPQTEQAIEFCMSWIKSLIKRL